MNERSLGSGQPPPPASSVLEMAHYSHIPRRQARFSPTLSNYIPALLMQRLVSRLHTPPRKTKSRALTQRVSMGSVQLEVCLGAVT